MTAAARFPPKALRIEIEGDNHQNPSMEHLARVDLERSLMAIQPQDNSRINAWSHDGYQDYEQGESGTGSVCWRYPRRIVRYILETLPSINIHVESIGNP